MRAFRSEEQPILIDAVCAQAIKLSYNVKPLAMSIHLPGQLQQHQMLAVREPRSEDERLKAMRKPTGFAPTLAMTVTDWLRVHQKHMQTALVAGQLSDAQKHMVSETVEWILHRPCMDCIAWTAHDCTRLTNTCRARAPRTRTAHAHRARAPR